MEDGNSETFGTALLVGANWYARLVDGGGVLIPLRIDAALASELVHEGAYAFAGRIGADHRGCPREFVATAARRIGADA